MKNLTEGFETGRPTQGPLELVDFCLSALRRDQEHELGDDINRYLTFEELLGTLLKVRDHLVWCTADTESEGDE